MTAIQLDRLDFHVSYKNADLDAHFETPQKRSQELGGAWGAHGSPCGALVAHGGGHEQPWATHRGPLANGGHGDPKGAHRIPLGLMGVMGKPLRCPWGPMGRKVPFGPKSGHYFKKPPIKRTCW